MRFDVLQAVAQRGTGRLAELVRTAVAAGAPARVAFVGGVFADEDFRTRVRDGIMAALPHAEIVAARYEPVYGALLLAYRERAIGVTELHE